MVKQTLKHLFQTALKPYLTGIQSPLQMSFKVLVHLMHSSLRSGNECPKGPSKEIKAYYIHNPISLVTPIKCKKLITQTEVLFKRKAHTHIYICTYIYMHTYMFLFYFNLGGWEKGNLGLELTCATLEKSKTTDSEPCPEACQ